MRPSNKARFGAAHHSMRIWPLFGGLTMKTDRRAFLRAAAAIGAAAAWSGPALASSTNWRERRDLFPAGRKAGEFRSRRRSQSRYQFCQS